MPYTRDLAVHEKLELHELLTFKTACAAKASMMQNQVQDAQLKGLLNQVFFARAFSIKLQVIFPYYCISISHNVANPVLSLYSIKSKEYAGIKYLNLSTNINGGENSPPLAS